MIKETIEKNSQAKVNSREIELLKRDFPQCFDKDGKFDLKEFEDLISTEEVDIKKEGYSLDFLGKSYARYLASLDSETVIVPDEDNKIIDSQNVYIVGDNLDALQHLKYSYSDQIKCIYIDPPYNTGSDGFVYNDKFEFTAEELARKINIEEDEAQRVLDMQGTSTHSAWLTFMYPRLELAKELLSEDGVIFISVDDNEQANCKLLCDLVFGEGNFIGCIAVENDSRVRTYDALAITHEYLLIYKKSVKFVYNVLEDPQKEFQYSDDEGGFDLYELRNRNSDFNINNRPNLYYPFWVNPNNVDENGLYELSLEAQEGWIKFYPQESQGIKTVWRWGRDKSMQNLNKVIFGRLASGGWQVVKKYRGFTYSLNSVWTGNKFSSDNGTLAFKSLFDKKRIFAFPKPIELIEQCLKISCGKGDIILDFFSGSATTAHAVMQRNIEEETNCNYILVQLNEPVKKGSEAEKAGYKTIDEIGRERIRRAAKKLLEAYPEKAKCVDLGFKTYYLKTTDKYTLDKIAEFDPRLPIDGEDIKSKFGVDTVLETWKIRDGYGFNVAVQTVDLQGYTAYLLSDSKVGTSLYLIDDMPEKTIIELVRKIEAHELNIDRIIEYGYAFSYTTNTALRSNLKTLKNRTSIEPILRY